MKIVPSTATADVQQDRTSTLWPDVSLLGAVLIWGINIPVMKIGLDHLDPFVFNAIRLVTSAAVLTGFAVCERYRTGWSRSGISWLQILIYGFLAAGLYQLLFLLGIAGTTAGNTGLIMATIPAWTALLSTLFIGEKLVRRAWGGLLLALLGTVIVALQNEDLSSGTEHLIGNLIILGAALTWAGGTVYSRPLLRSVSPIQLSAAATVITLPLHLLVAAGRYEQSWTQLQSVNLWLIILYAGALSSGLSLPMWSYGVRHAGAAHAATLQNLVPLIAIGVAWFSRGEAVTETQLCGGALILGGLIIMRRSRQTSSFVPQENIIHTAEAAGIEREEETASR
ncbi:MAG: DMT family transporter [Fuerstiella sp.]|nr:DMT family transporter [Fuerstiella sp.]